MSPKLRVGIAFLAPAEGLVAYATFIPQRGWPALLGALSLWSFVAAGMVAWHLRPENRTGALMVAVGLMYPLAHLSRVHTPVTWTAGILLGPYWIIAFVYLLVSFPRGYVQGRFERLVVTGAAFEAIFWNPLILLFRDSSAPNFGAPSGLNLLHVSDNPATAGMFAQLSTWLDLSVLMVMLTGLLLRWRRASPPARRTLSPVFLTGCFAISFILVPIEAGNFWPGARFITVLFTLAPLAVATLPFGFLFGLLRARSRRARVGDLVVELGGLPSREGFQAALSRALGDPSVMVGLWSSEAHTYLGTGEIPLTMPQEQSTRAITFLERRNEPLAAIVHDQALLDDPSLIKAVSAAARLAVENELLQAKVEEQLHEVRESRSRIVQAADEERRRVERNLHDGAQQRLVSLSLALRSTETMLDEHSDAEAKMSLQAAAKELEEAINEIRELARGIHPSILTDQGLAAAIEALSERSAVPITIEKFPSNRLPAPVEATGYFIIAEALANAVKHAGASIVRVAGKLEDGLLILEVFDDGVGGAHMDEAGGLRGLADRVEALDGTFQVQSPPGGGTRIKARIPCAH